MMVFVLRHCAIALYQPLYHLFNLSLTQHYLPVEWRTHLIKPIFKSGDKGSIRNYRPISLLWRKLYIITLLTSLPNLYQRTSSDFLGAVLLYNSYSSFSVLSLALSHKQMLCIWTSGKHLILLLTTNYYRNSGNLVYVTVFGNG